MNYIYELLRKDQDETSKYIQTILTELDIKFSVDEYGNIFNLDFDNSPVLSCHMDTVRDDSDICISSFLAKNDCDTISTGGILGGDDKCGAYIILKVLESKRKVNFIFSRDEEIGCKGIDAFFKDESQITRIKELPYALVLDRKGNKDIICSNNDYGIIEFENALVKVANKTVMIDNSDGTKIEKSKYEYIPTTGAYSDADKISKYISCANLSVGYYNPHSKNEFISKKDLTTAFEYVCDIIDDVKEKFSAPCKSFKPYNYKKQSYNKYGTYSYNFDYLNDDYYDCYDKNYFLKEDTCDFCGKKGKVSQIFMPNSELKNICCDCAKDLMYELAYACDVFKF